MTCAALQLRVTGTCKMLIVMTLWGRPILILALVSRLNHSRKMGALH